MALAFLSPALYAAPVTIDFDALSAGSGGISFPNPSFEDGFTLNGADLLLSPTASFEPLFSNPNFVQADFAQTNVDGTLTITETDASAFTFSSFVGSANGSSSATGSITVEGYANGTLVATDTFSITANNATTYNAANLAQQPIDTLVFTFQNVQTSGVNFFASADNIVLDDEATLATRDFGDAPKDMSSIDADLGNAYPTLLADNGPRHTVVAGVHLGTLIDAEVDGLPNLAANGDDTTDLPDEDGVVFNPALGLSGNLLLSGVQNTLQVTASVAGYLSAWIDYNQNGNFTDTGEQLFNDQAVTAGVNTLHFTTPTTAPHGATYMRFRFATGTGEANTPVGAAPNGEVEDYQVELALPRAQTCDADLVNGSFEPPPTSTASLQSPSASVPGWAFRASDPTSGANFFQRHSIEIWRSGFLGVPAHEGTQFAEINGFVPGNLYQDVITVPGQTLFWQFAHRGRVGTDVMALRIGAPGAALEVFRASDDTSAWGVYNGSYTVPAGQTITRFEFQSVSTGSGDGSTGNFVDAIHFSLPCDFGDNPTSYPVVGANAASHIIAGPFLGTVPDAEPDGQPSVQADGDDLNGVPDDEDGVTGFANPVPGLASYSVDVAVHNPGAGAATLYGWIDFNGNGQFEASEAQTLAIAAGDVGTKQLTWPSPVFTLQAGKPVYTRFRITTDTLTDNGGTAVDERAQGPASDGEVEDHSIQPVGSLTIVKQTVAGGDADFAFTSGQLPDFTLTTSGGTAARTFADLAIGHYDVGETVPAGWTLTSATCDNGNDPARITLEAGQSVTCTFVNTINGGTIIIDKATLPSGGTGFGFTQTIDASGPFGLDDGGSKTYANVLPGSYTVTENDPSGNNFKLSGLTCNDPTGDSGVNPASRTATIALAPGETVTCTFTNTELNSVVVEKATLPAGGTQSFSFTPNIDGSTIGFILADGQTKRFDAVNPGTDYSVTETAAGAGYDLADIQCFDSATGVTTPGNVGTGTATFDIAGPGEVIHCTFTNAKRGHILVDKVTAPSGDPTLFSFALGGGPDSIQQSFALSDAAAPHDSGEIKPGTYDLTETVAAGWTLSSASCDDGSDPAAVQLDPGESVTCTFTNTKQTGTIVIAKATLPAGGTGFDFSQDMDAGGNFQLDDGATKTFSDIPVGSYSVTESDPAGAGYELTGLECVGGSASVDKPQRTADIDLGAGETVTCTFTNTKQGTVVVAKTTEPANAGGSFHFSHDLDASGGFDLGGGQSRTFNLVPVGFYTITESDPGAEFDLTAVSCVVDGVTVAGDPIARSVSFNINGPGAQVNCSFINTQRGTVVIKKETAPGGGAGFVFDQDLDANGAFTLDDGGSKTFARVLPGSYAVSEDDPAGSGFKLSGLHCTGPDSSADIGARTAYIEVNPGELVTCTFTNTEQDTVTIEKITVPAGAPGSFEFDTNIKDPFFFQLRGGESQVYTNVAPSVYDILERNIPAGFELTDIQCHDTATGQTFSGDLANASVQLTLDAGERVHCAFTNTRQGTIVIEKVTAPAGGTAAFGFSQTIDGSGNFSLTDGGSKTFDNLSPGDYSVTEHDPSTVGYQLSGLSCDDADSSADTASRTVDIRLQAGETVTCRYTNSAENTVIVEKVTEPAGAAGSFTFSQTIDASGDFALVGGGHDTFENVAPGQYSVTEQDPGADFDLTAIDCHDTASGQTFPGDLASRTANIGLTLDERVHCTFTNTQRGSITINKVTVPAGGSGFGFSQNVDAGGPFNLDDGGSVTFDQVRPGSYAVTEDLVSAGYDLTGITCSDTDSSSDLASRRATIRVSPGEAVTCTFTNAQENSIVIEKVTDPVGAAGSFTFSQDIDAGGDFSLGGGQQRAFDNVPAGTYTIAETIPGADFDLTAIDCVDAATGSRFSGNTDSGAVSLALTNGGRFHCVYTNTQRITPPVKTGTVEGTVYIDANGNGRWEPGIDQPIVGAQVDITDSGNTLVSLVTDASGHFATTVPIGPTLVDVDQTGAGFPAVTGLTVNTWGEGTDPTTVTVPDGGTATDNTGYRAALDCNVICDVEPAGGDGDVDRGDIFYIFRHRGQVVTPPGAANSGDCNGDGVLAIDDARACQAFYH